jgi:hypothetical protein
LLDSIDAPVSAMQAERGDTASHSPTHAASAVISLRQTGRNFLRLSGMGKPFILVRHHPLIRIRAAADAGYPPVVRRECRRNCRNSSAQPPVNRPVNDRVLAEHLTGNRPAISAYCPRSSRVIAGMCPGSIRVASAQRSTNSVSSCPCQVHDLIVATTCP